MTKWTQLYITGQHATRQSMKRVDDHLQTIGAVMHVPPHGDGLPVAESDGSYEVRVLSGDPGFAKFILTQHYGLTIVREQTNEDGA